jgi:hypothetical protein
MYFRKENQEKPTNGNIKPKEVLKNPQDKNFFNLHFMADWNTKRLGIAGQILSGITEFIGIVKLSNFSFPLWQWSNIIPILTGLFAVYVFEWLGVRVFLVQTVKILTERKNAKNDIEGTEAETTETATPKKWENTALLRFNIFFLVVILLANAGVSLVGQQGILFEKKHATADDEIFKLEEEKAAKIEKLENKIIANSAGATAAKQAAKQAIKDQYNLDVAAEQKRIKQELADIEKGQKNSKATQYFDKLKLEANARSSKILADLKQHRDADLKEADKANNYDETALRKQIENIEKSYHKMIAHKDRKAGQTAGFYKMLDGAMFWLLIGFMLLSWLAIMYDEIYKSGSQMEIEIKEVEANPSLSMLFWDRLNFWFYHIGYRLITGILGTKNYKYKDPRKAAELYEHKGTSFKFPSLFGGETETKTVTEIGYKKTGVTACDTEELERNKTTSKQDEFWTKHSRNKIRNYYNRGVKGISSTGVKVGEKSQKSNFERLQNLRKEAANCGIDLDKVMNFE